MKVFLAFVKKEFFHIFRDPRTLLILLGMPVVQIILFGFALSVEINNINVAIVAPERTETIRQITDKIAANRYFTVTGIYDSEDKPAELMRREKANVILRFNHDFNPFVRPVSETQMQIIANASNPNTAVQETMYMQSVINDYFREKQVSSVTPTISPVVRYLYNPGMQSAFNFVPGILGLLMIIICTMMTSVSIVREKETGTMEELLVSPVKPINIILAKMVPYFALSCVNLVTILLISRFVLNVPVSGSIFAIFGISLIYIILALALGMLISSIVKTQVAAMLISAMSLMLPVIILSGMIFPIESAPEFFRWLSCIIPARWYIAAMRKLMIEGLPITYVIKEIVILCGMAITLISISLLKFKNRLE